jgi:hypothetical protein
MVSRAVRSSICTTFSGFIYIEVTS